MIEEIKKPFTFKQFEFWAATIIYTVSVWILVFNQLTEGYAPNRHFFEDRHLYFSSGSYYFIPQLCLNTIYYGGFLLLALLVQKTIEKPSRLLITAPLAVAIYFLAATGISAADTWIMGYLFKDHNKGEVYSIVFDGDFMFTLMLSLIFGIYTVIIYVLKYMLSSFYIGYKKFDISYKRENSAQIKHEVKRECIVALIVWFLWFALFSHKTSREFYTIFSEVVILGIAIYWFSFNILIPQLLIKNGTFQNYLIKITGVLATSIVPVTLITAASRIEVPIFANVFTIGISLFFIAPITWFLYQYRFVQQAELKGLKTALGQSTADLDFLRSQINPHFLFNALNTLYGTALQEKAERTGEGIQRLGDMMRFMLQENHEDKILLTRETEYLQNYIELQKLRTQTSPDIIINTEIDDQPNRLKVAPMLLIPFIENAFKHGISLREPSHIKISLHVNDKQLLFDVSNSIHIKPDNDPEKGKSGIGLENVKQRLQLLYPDSHELIIHQNAKEFFIHLIINLA